jgi:hypothetical protein
MMHSTSHLTVNMVKHIFDRAFTGSVTDADKQAARHLRNLLVESHAVYTSVLFDIMQQTSNRDRTDVAEMVFLVGLQAGYEIGIVYPPAPSAL